MGRSQAGDEAARPGAEELTDARRAARRAVATWIRALIVVVGVMPWLIAVARGLLPLGRFGDVVDGAFRPFCHRLPERSLALAGVPMPVCSRCAGIFGGVALGALIARPRVGVGVWRALIALAGVAMLVDVVTQDLGVHPIWHAARLATGGAFGYAMAASLATQLRVD